MENVHQSEKFVRAQRQVAQIKKFYKHVRIFIVVNIILLLIKFKVQDYFDSQGFNDENFVDWFEWNIIGTPILWGIILLVHGIYVFKFKAIPWTEMKPGFVKNWEKKQIEKFLKEEDDKSKP
ncbi:2TM domain-containing protein [Maribacter sp. MMG018]|uniref:2TM domain-containing protein n=1 Tax=Maribacter sp. MMG018 TaxID=2822688 RepID=UPI001B38AD53|nr:2TM domain-containing protein [Maribacter sp. MMG018]MBQ4914773.1 2TM domain-containing protein [Maribacter sp. MMG018]